MLSWLSRATLDIIGLTGFSYSFDALKCGEESNELGYAFAQIFNSAKSASIFSLLQGRIPILQWIVRLFLVLPFNNLFHLTQFSRCACSNDRRSIKNPGRSTKPKRP